MGDKMPITEENKIKIRDIIKKDGDFLRFHIHDCGEGKFSLMMEEIPWTEKFGKTIRIEIQSRRLQQLANEILNHLNRKAKLQKWKPTIWEIISKVQEIVSTSGINYWSTLMDAVTVKTDELQPSYKSAVERWFINWVRRVHTMKDKQQVAEARRIYEWLQSNKEWLYSDS